jgi:hypothetical protein
MTDGRQLAQINVARMVAPLDSPEMAEFVAQLAEINALAERSPGFIWRLQGDGGDSTAIRAFDDPMVLVNMSVWTSIDALRAYVYRSAHALVMRDRKKWFARHEGPYYAMWWVSEGHIPSVEEGKQRLELLAKDGPTVRAFWFGTAFDPTGAGEPSPGSSARTRVT